MPWDFETEPEFQQKLDWMRSFIDAELIPLEPVFERMPASEWALVKRHLQKQVKTQGLWACHLDASLGGPGFGQMKLALMHELIGRCPYSMEIFGNQAPDSGNSELLAAVAVVTKPGCPHCARAKQLLREHGMPFEELVLGRDVSPSVLRALAGSGSVPQVFVNGRHVGGADRLEADLAA